MRALGADVSQFDKPVSAQFMLDCKVPLLSRGCDPVEWYFKTDEAVYVAGEARAALIGIGGRVSISQRATGCEAGKERGAGHESRAQHSERRNASKSCCRVGLEEVGQAACARQEVDRDGEERRGER